MFSMIYIGLESHELVLLQNFSNARAVLGCGSGAGAERALGRFRGDYRCGLYRIQAWLLVPAEAPIRFQVQQKRLDKSLRRHRLQIRDRRRRKPDELFVFEAKAALAGAPRSRLQDAIDDSTKVPRSQQRSTR